MLWHDKFKYGKFLNKYFIFLEDKKKRVIINSSITERIIILKASYGTIYTDN
jgi:hypothetical protein